MFVCTWNTSCTQLYQSFALSNAREQEALELRPLLSLKQPLASNGNVKTWRTHMKQQVPKCQVKLAGKLLFRCWTNSWGWSPDASIQSEGRLSARGCAIRWSTPDDELAPPELPISTSYILISLKKENHLLPINFWYFLIDLWFRIFSSVKIKHKADYAGSLKQNKPCDLMRRDGKPMSEERLRAMSELSVCWSTTYMSQISLVTTAGPGWSSHTE